MSDGVDAFRRRAIPSLLATYPRAPEDLATFTMLALSCIDSKRYLRREGACEFPAPR